MQAERSKTHTQIHAVNYVNHPSNDDDDDDDDAGRDANATIKSLNKTL